MRILIAYGKDVIRKGLISCLSRLPDVKSVRVSEYSEDIVKKAKRLKPDIILTDGNVSGGDFSQVVRQLHEELPGTRVAVIIPLARGYDNILSYLDTNADGYIDLDIDARQLSEALKHVCSGRNIVCPSITQALLAKEKAIDDKPKVKQDFELTERESQVLTLVARGQSNREIAETIFVSENTIKAHVQNILRKMKVSTRMQAVILATENGLITSSTWSNIVDKTESP